MSDNSKRIVFKKVVFSNHSGCVVAIFVGNEEQVHEAAIKDSYNYGCSYSILELGENPCKSKLLELLSNGAELKNVSNT